MKSYSDTAAFFNSIDKHYDEWFVKDKYYMEMLKKIIELLSKYHSTNIVEFGCGTGNLSILLGEFFPQANICCIDISNKLLESAIQKCKSYKNIEFLECNIMDYASKLSTSCSIVANYSLHHLVDDEKKELLNHLSRNMIQGDVLIIGDVCFNSTNNVTPDNRHKNILDLFNARAHYYLETVDFARCVFEVEHLPLVLNSDREYLVNQYFWPNIGRWFS